MTKRTYETAQIRVHWNSERCIHSANCLKALPQVFDVQRRPWIDINAAGADAIAQTVEKCPSGALAHERLDGKPGEQIPAKITIVASPNGPLYVHGEVEVRDARGNLFDRGVRMALCRCGHSKNQPFCDLSHREARFRDIPMAIEPTREQAQSPVELKPDSKA